MLIALDFKKAFDSVNRKGLIKTMIKYRINPEVIDLVAKIYESDSTSIKMAGREEEISISSGIRQGCTGSTAFFKLVTYEIIKKLQEMGEKYIIDNIDMNSIFFADDSIMFAKTIKAARKNLKIVSEVSKEFGLTINEGKSKVMIFKKGQKKLFEQIKELEGIEVVDKIKYLGIEINEGRDIFKKHKEEAIDRAREMANRTYWTIETCCNKVLMG